MIIFHGYSREFTVFIDLKTAADYRRMFDKLFTHDEYSTDWSNFVGEAEKVSPMLNIIREDLVGVDKVVITLTFVNADDKDLIYKVNDYLHGTTGESHINLAVLSKIKS